MGNSCCDELMKMKAQFTSLLIAVGNSNLQRTHNAKTDRLIRSGFAPKVVKSVAAKMSKSGRPANHYSKTTGMLKKS